MKDYFIRRIKSDELYLLEDFLYEAVFQKDETNLIPRDVIKKPALRVYIDNFGTSKDDCLVAEMDGSIVGVVWTRIISGSIKGYGYVDDESPELSISLLKNYRNLGIGTSLMQNMLQLLKDKGYKQTSLSVEKANYAVNMYLSLGYEIVCENEHDYIMTYKLN